MRSGKIVGSGDRRYGYGKKTSRVDGIGDAKRVNSGGGRVGGGGDRGCRWIGVVGGSKGASVEGAF